MEARATSELPGPAYSVGDPVIKDFGVYCLSGIIKKRHLRPGGWSYEVELRHTIGDTYLDPHVLESELRRPSK